MVLFVGDKPSKRMKPQVAPFEGAACEERLISWLWELDLKDTQFLIVNQCDYTYAWFVAYESRGNIIIALGNNASKALGVVPHFKLPHPSGRNRQINDKAFIDQKLIECKNYISLLTSTK